MAGLDAESLAAVQQVIPHSSPAAASIPAMRGDGANFPSK
jgi:hypothetical protein